MGAPVPVYPSFSGASTPEKAGLYNTRLLLARLLPVELFAIPLDGPAGTNPYVAPAARSVTLPDNAKAAWCGDQTFNGHAADAAAFARAGAGTLGPMLLASSPVAAPPARGWAVTPTGDFIFNNADLWTLIDLAYPISLQDIVNIVCPVVPGTGIVTLPAGLPGLLSILEAEALAGGVNVKQFIQVPVGYTGSGALTTGQTALAAGKQGISMCPADAVTSVRLKLGVIPAPF